MAENVELEASARVMELVFVEQGLPETIAVRSPHYLSVLSSKRLIACWEGLQVIVYPVSMGKSAQNSAEGIAQLATPESPVQVYASIHLLTRI